MYSSFEVLGFCSILTATMQRGLTLIAVGMLLCLSTGAAFARDTMKIDEDEPADFQAIEDDLQDIKDYLSDVQCGGWNMQQHVPGTISTVTGVPGRYGQWDGAPLSGMATRYDANSNGNRDDDFQYPSGSDAFTKAAEGLSTTCKPGQTEIQKKVWREGGAFPGQIVEVDVTYPHPKFEDPSCRWRVKDADGNFTNTAPKIPLDDNSPIPQFDQLQDGPDRRNPPGDRHSPPLCTEFCNYLNTWQYKDCLATGEITDPVSGTTYSVCTEWGKKYLCSDQKVDDTKIADSCLPAVTEMSNSRLCKGAECRCEEDGGPEGVNGCVQNPGTKEQEAPVYYSYARAYEGDARRDVIASDHNQDNNLLLNVPIACYGFYNEFDPKYHQTEDKDRRCVINIDVSGMRESQKGKGYYGQNESLLKDVDPIEPSNQRVKKGDAKDVWYLKLGWGFSLLKEESFRADYNRDLSAVFGDTQSLDRAKMTGTWQISKTTEGPRLAYSNNLRSYDDTGEKRIVSSWWQKQQTDVNTILHPPIVRIMLPPSYSFGADPTDPLFANPNAEPATEEDKKTADEMRSERIEVQINAAEDLLGEALGVVERSFLVHLEEDPVPVLVPMGSPTEFRSRAEQWCAWYMQKSGDQNCENAPTEIRDVIEKLESYADDIERVRELRALLATYAGEVLKIQSELTRPISEWMRENLDTYNNYIQTQINFGFMAGEQWKQVRELMSDFHDKTNLPWCMIQRFETPIYSLLDSWLPSRSVDGRMTADNLPNITAPRAKDLIIDFSNLRYMTGSLMVPVLKPVQIRMNFPRLPKSLEQADLDTIDALPDLPSIDDIRTAMEEAMDELPEVDAEATYDPLDLPPVDEAALAEVQAKIMAIKDVVRDMDDRYGKFWKSIGPLSTDDIDTERDGIPEMKKRLECKEWNDDVCQHVEMDLIERMQRINSRKMVFLAEDYLLSSVPRITPAFCQPMDQVCLFLHGEKPAPAYQWEIIAPKTLPNSGEEARSAVRDATLPEPVGGMNPDDFPSYDTDINSLLPFHDVQEPLNLFPDTEPIQ